MKPNKKSQNLDRKIRKKPKNINHCLIMLILTISRTFFFNYYYYNVCNS